jgi:glycosyltransferase involved in cell wall biosynthesis
MLLSIIVPTYSRYEELGRCLDSIQENLSMLSSDEKEALEIIVGDNASPRDTTELLTHRKLDCNILFIRRKKNIGITQNILDLTRRSSGEFILWLTDDDLLTKGGLPYLFEQLRSCPSDVGFLWGCLPTFDARDGKIFTIASRVFEERTVIESGRTSASIYSKYGWALTRQIYRKKVLNLDGAGKINNAYFPIFLASEAMIAAKSVYLDVPYVLHSYYNQEFWDEWGEDLFLRKLRIFCDSLWVMDLSIRPEPHEHAILQNIRSYRESEMRGFFTSDLFKSTVALKGGQFALELIGDHLADYPHIMAEIVEFINHRMP